LFCFASAPISSTAQPSRLKTCRSLPRYTRISVSLIHPLRFASLIPPPNAFSLRQRYPGKQDIGLAQSIQRISLENAQHATAAVLVAVVGYRRWFACCNLHRLLQLIIKFAIIIVCNKLKLSQQLMTNCGYFNKHSLLCVKFLKFLFFISPSVLALFTPLLFVTILTISKFAYSL